MARRSKMSKVALGGVVLAGILCGVVLGLVVAIGVDLPQVQALEQYEPGAATRILSRDGVVLAELYIEKRLPLALADIPEALKNAVISVEDRRFLQHPGLDVIRNFGALVADIRARAMVEGASTITQQLARNLFLTPEKTMSRKLKEMFLALQIERHYTKDEILKLYLNQIYFGSGAYGVGAAAQIYFNKKVQDLTLGECALLAGLPQAPSRYSPFDHPERATSRRRIVLQAMVREGHLTEAQADKAAEAPLHLAVRRPDPIAPYFVQQVRTMLLDRFGENAVYKGGLVVETTLDFRMQQAAEKVMDQGLELLVDKIGPTEGRPENGQDGQGPKGAVVALEVGSGGILAWVGGPDFESNPLDHVSQAPVSPGSALRPFIYGEAIESGLSQADLVWDAPITYRIDGQAQPWRPQNASRRYEGEITLRRALEISGNIPAIKILSRVGVDRCLALSRKLGLGEDLARDLTLAMGEGETTLLALTAAYQALAGRGLWIEPHAVVQVKDRGGRVIFRATPERKSALSPETAFIVTDMMTGVVENGIAQRAKSLKRPVAGMPGSTKDFRNALFLGYTPQVVAGVWIGFDSKRTLGPEGTGPRLALPIWIDFMEQALKDVPPAPFERPVGIVMASMNRFSGTSAPTEDPGQVMAAFKEGSAPASHPGSGL